jgi:hypothetical protein
MILVTCGTLEDEFFCICSDLTRGSLFMKAQGHLDIHLGHEADNLDDVIPLFGHMGEGTLSL